jgi:hypothetical protein
LGLETDPMTHSTRLQVWTDPYALSVFDTHDIVIPVPPTCPHPCLTLVLTPHPHPSSRVTAIQVPVRLTSSLLPTLSALTGLCHKSMPLNICQTIVQCMMSSTYHLSDLTRAHHHWKVVYWLWVYWSPFYMFSLSLFHLRLHSFNFSYSFSPLPSDSTYCCSFGPCTHCRTSLSHSFTAFHLNTRLSSYTMPCTLSPAGLSLLTSTFPFPLLSLSA